MMRKVSLAVLALLFTGAGILHLNYPQPFVEIVPPALPRADWLVFWSGIAELAGGIGILVPATRVAAGWGLAALLTAVFPANVYMAVRNVEPAGFVIPQVLLWLRLPLQPLLIWWVIAATRARF